MLVAMDMTVGIIRANDPISISYTEMKRTHGNCICESLIRTLSNEIKSFKLNNFLLKYYNE